MAFRHLPAILAFLIGISVANALHLYPKRRDVSAPYIAVLGLEIGILTGLSLLPAKTPDVLFTTSIAFAASVQVQTFREVDGHSFSSTFTTGNLRTLTEAAFAWFFEGRAEEKARVIKDFSLICAAFFAGAAAGGYATQLFGNATLWCDILLLLLIAIGVRHRLRIIPAKGR